MPGLNSIQYLVPSTQYPETLFLGTRYRVLATATMRTFLQFVLVTLLLAALGQAQSFDNFRGLVTDAHGNPGPIGPGVADQQSCSFSRAGTTITALCSNGTVYHTGESTRISGTSSALDWVPCNAANVTGGACANKITNIVGNTLTMTSPGTGAVSSVAGTLAPATWYFAQDAVGWKLFDPQDHWLFWEMVGAPCAGQNQLPCAMSGATFTAKYGSTCAGAAAEALQWMGTGGGGYWFNGFGDDGESAYDPSAGGACPSNPKFTSKKEQFFTLYGSANVFGGSWGGLDQPIKNLDFGTDSHYPCSLRRPQLDYFDGRWLTFLENFPPKYNSSVNNFYASPFVAGLEIDDTGNVMFADAGADFHTLPHGHNDCDGALLVAETAPLQTYSNSPLYGSGPYLYPDPKVYSKTLSAVAPGTCSIASPCSWPDLLRNRYTTIAALNAAWSTGGHYTSFGSSATATTGEALVPATGDGTTKTFANTLANANVQPFSVQITSNGTDIAGDCPAFASAAGASVACPNDGAGKGRIASSPATTLTSASVITYASGVISITFNTAPLGGVAIAVNYSSGGWDSGGSGVVDEDGSSSWFGTNARCLLGKPNWASATSYVIGNIVRDPTSHSWQVATTNGTSSGSSPAFSASAGTPTNDNGIVWESEGAPVCGSDAGSDYPAANMNPVLAQDENDFLGQFSAVDFAAMHTAWRLNYPDWPILGLDQLGVAFAPPRQPVLEAAAQYFDAAYTELAPPPLDPNGDAKFTFFTEWFPGPVLFYQNLASSQGQTGCSSLVDPGCQATQALRGAAWNQEIQFCLTQKGYDGKTHCVGQQWWGSHAFQSVGWGLNTNLDNPYDGASDVTATLSCPAPLAAFHCGGETSASWNGSNAITGAGEIAAANALWTASAPQPGWALSQFTLGKPILPVYQSYTGSDPIQWPSPIPDLGDLTNNNAQVEDSSLAIGGATPATLIRCTDANSVPGYTNTVYTAGAGGSGDGILFDTTSSIVHLGFAAQGGIVLMNPDTGVCNPTFLTRDLDDTNPGSSASPYTFGSGGFSISYPYEWVASGTTTDTSSATEVDTYAIQPLRGSAPGHFTHVPIADMVYGLPIRGNAPAWLANHAYAYGAYISYSLAGQLPSYALNSAFSLGDLIQPPASVNPSNCAFKVTQAGTTNLTTTPVWGSTCGLGVVTDGGVIWKGIGAPAVFIFQNVSGSGTSGGSPPSFLNAASATAKMPAGHPDLVTTTSSDNGITWENVGPNLTAQWDDFGSAGINDAYITIAVSNETYGPGTGGYAAWNGGQGTGIFAVQYDLAKNTYHLVNTATLIFTDFVCPSPYTGYDCSGHAFTPVTLGRSTASGCEGYIHNDKAMDGNFAVVMRQSNIGGTTCNGGSNGDGWVWAPHQNFNAATQFQENMFQPNHWSVMHSHLFAMTNAGYPLNAGVSSVMVPLSTPELMPPVDWVRYPCSSSTTPPWPIPPCNVQGLIDSHLGAAAAQPDTFPTAGTMFDLASNSPVENMAWQGEEIADSTTPTTTFPGSGPLIGSHVWRFTHTFATESNPGFSAQFSISQFSQDGKFLAFTTDWAGQFGATTGIAPTVANGQLAVNPPAGVTFTCLGAPGWTPGAVYATGALLGPATGFSGTGTIYHVYQATVGGTAGTATPNWSTSSAVGTTVPDGGVTWNDRGPGNCRFDVVIAKLPMNPQ